MAQLPKLSAAEMERMTPDERSRAVRKRQLQSLDQLDPEFRDRVEGTGRELLKELEKSKRQERRQVERARRAMDRCVAEEHTAENDDD